MNMSTSVPAPPNAAPIVVPEKQAGGGVTAESKGLKAVSSFGPSVMGYLKEMSAGVRPLGREQYNEIEGVPEKSTVDEAEKVDLQLLFAFMRSEKSNAMMPAPKADLDLSHPLSSYFISSSHNTYLSGNQLYGSSNAEAYYNVRIEFVFEALHESSNALLGPRARLSLCGDRCLGRGGTQAPKRGRGEREERGLQVKNIRRIEKTQKHEQIA